eukprot:366157-Chlamydomonas_euryale.AAC.18
MSTSVDHSMRVPIASMLPTRRPHGVFKPMHATGLYLGLVRALRAWRKGSHDMRPKAAGQRRPDRISPKNTACMICSPYQGRCWRGSSSLPAVY